MNPFNLEDALAGAPVVTRDGREVKDVCYLPSSDSVYKVRAVVGVDIIAFTEEGCYSLNRVASELDLLMAPVKKEGWINLYPFSRTDTKLWADASNVYRTQQDALDNAADSCIATVHIEWEE